MQQINNTTFAAPELGDIKPVVTIGGSDPSKFIPNLNMGYSFGGGEEYFDNLNRTDKVTSSKSDVRYDGDKVQLITGSDIDEFYADASGQMKWDVVFEKCPESMVLEWKRTCSEGLSAYYQDNLENEWKKESQGVSLEEYLATHNRPDDVIGSYAIYCDKANNFIKPLNAKKEIPANWKAQIKAGAALADVNIDYYREYKNGKIGHKHRPFVIDANGKTAWCSLLIVGNVERVTLPGSFMKSAAYPVRLDPTIGYTTAGASSAGWSNFLLYNCTIPESGTTSSVYAYVGQNGGETTNAYLGLYGDISGVPGNAIEYNLSISVLNTGWYSRSLGGDILSSGLKYYPALLPPAKNDPVFQSYINYYEDSGAGVNTYYRNACTLMPFSAGTLSESSSKPSLYLEYTASGGSSGHPAASRLRNISRNKYVRYH